MDIVLDVDYSIPAFARWWMGDEVTKLVEQIKKLVRRGEILPGHSLPSVRQLANDLELDESTVAKAYRLLERDGVIQANGWWGACVHPDAPANSAIASR